eukprot:3560874-Amphidinium_carterae.1
MLRKGVPAKYRKDVWWSVLGCEAARTANNKSFTELCKTDIERRVSEEIERDLARSFPNHTNFQRASAGGGQEQLRQVLHAFAVQWPSVKYCQGLNYIGGLLIIVFENTEMAFWALSCALERLSVSGHFEEGMALLRGDMQVLDKLLGQKCPRVAKLLQKANIDAMLICSEWFLTWYAKSLPHSTTLRIWDALFYEGFKVLFRIAIAIFKRSEADIVKCGGDFEMLMQHCKSWAHQQVEHNELLKVAFSLEPLRRDYLQ